MAKCEWCGKEFDLDEAEDYFEAETWLLSYSNIKKCLCGECAVDAIKDEVDGVYYETCESCGKSFDLIEDQSQFDSYEGGARLRDYWHSQILCADCAIESVESSEFYDDEEDSDDFDDDED